ncbi:MAG: FmdB family zinc ribbon protein [Thermodesulfobacteriota bacterium]
MPITKFECQSCGKEFAKIFTDAAGAPRSCPVCGADQLKELGPAFHPDVLQIRRAGCMSCGSCEEELSCSVAASHQ